MTVGSSAKDEAGNALEEPYTWSFTTEAKAEKEEEAGISPMLFVIPIVILVIVSQLVSFYKKKKRKSADLLEKEPREKRKMQKIKLKS